MKDSTVIGLAIAGFAVLVVGGTVVGNYNSLVSGENQIQSAQSQVENVIERRYEILKNNAAIVKSYSGTQKELVANFTKALSEADQARSVARGDWLSLQRFDAATTNGLALFANLGSQVNPEVWKNVQVQIEGSQNRITVERKRLIDSINAQNNRVKRFPSNVFAGFFGFSEVPQYKAPEISQSSVDMDKLLN